MLGKACSKCKTDKPLSDFYKQGRAAYCIPCEKAYKREHYLLNTEKVKATAAAWSAANKDRKAAVNRAYREANAERCKANALAWSAKNWDKRLAASRKYRVERRERALSNEAAYRERNRQACNARVAEWKKRNPHKATHYFHKRRAAELQSTPLWADFDAIEAVYAEAQRIQAKTGVPQHVDHIVPLLSKLVCGLHCEANLRVIPASENNRKNNRHWPDMP
jgi:uncharacterized Zn finger protein (UPF0148 family)